MAQQSREISSEEQVRFLKKIEFFHDFEEHELLQLLEVTTWLRFAENKHVIREGALERAFYILIKGTVRVTKANAETGETILLNSIPEGYCFGEMSLVSETPRTADVVTDCESFLLKVDPDIINTSNVFLQLKFYKRFCEVLVNRLIIANKKSMGGETPEAFSFPEKKKDAPAAPVEKLGAAAPAAPKEKPPAAPSKPPALPKTAPAKSGRETAPVTAVDASALPPMPEACGKIASSRMQRQVDGIQALGLRPQSMEGLRPFIQGMEQNARRMADFINLDPALSLRVLQLANSPFFRRSRTLLTVPHAMIIVGGDTIRKDLEETIEASEDIEPFRGLTEQLGEPFWVNSVVVGRIAEMLKQVLRISIAPDAYLAGLLHRIGTLVLDALQPDFYPQLLRPGNDFGDRLLAAETEFVGADHCQAGAMYGKKCGLPQPYLEVMANYRTPQKAGEHQMLTALVHLATLFAANQGVRFGDTEETDRPVAESFAWVLVQEQFTPFMKADIPSFVANFEAEIGASWNDIVRDL